MTRRPPQVVRFWEVQHRPKFSKPYIVRWVVDGRPCSNSFRTKAQANRYRARLVTAHDDGEWFDLRHGGEPESWHSEGARMLVYEWVRKWLAEQWDELAPRTRTSYCQALARFVLLTVRKGSPKRPAEMLCWLAAALAPDVDVDPTDARERWLRSCGLTLGDLDRQLLADVDANLGKRVVGGRLAASTAARFRRYSRSCVRRAVALDLIPVDPWPPTQRGRSRRKANRVSSEVDIRRLPDPPTMRSVLAGLVNRSHPRASRRWQVMSDVGYHGGLRPSEIVMLRRRSLRLPYRPAGGWGLIDVTEADDGYDEAADPKTGSRSVPIPPVLSASLDDYVSDLDLGPGDLLFRTDSGGRPSLSNWRRALRRVCKLLGLPPLSPYDLRHACATTWLEAGVPLGEAARRLGHSVQTLVSHYVQALQGDEGVANQRIEAVLSTAVERPGSAPKMSRSR